MNIFGKLDKTALWIFIFAVAFRIVFIIVFPDVDKGRLMDSTRYQRVAVHLINGNGFTEYGDVPTAFSPPLYPFFIAGVFKIFGQSSVAVKIIQAIISGLTCMVILQLGKALFNRKVGNIAAAILALNPELIALSGYMYTETLYIFLSCLAFLFLLKGFKEKDYVRPWIIAGLFLGLSILTRHVLLAFPVFLFCAALLFSKTRIFWKRILVYSTACYLVITPWVIRNYVVFEEFIPVAAGAGGGLFMGSYIQDEGGYQYRKSVKLLIDESKGAKSYADRDGILMRKALRNILKHPWEYIKIVLNKIGRFFFQIYQARPKGGERQFDLKTALIMAMGYYPILILFLAGLWLTRKNWKVLLPVYSVIVYSSLLYSVMIFIPRYRIPLMPFFVMFAAYTTYQIWEYKWKASLKQRIKKVD